MTTVGGLRKPNFFIAGAPKSGTTALYSYLRQHPDIFMPERKEPNFFCSDLEISCAIPDEEEYLRLFAPAGTKRRIGEASVWYLFSRRAASAIKEFSPDASIIALLRNPVDMLHSLHGQRFLSGYESVADFRTALARQRKKDPAKLDLSRANQQMYAPFCTEIGNYAEQIERYFDVFGQANVKVIIYEDFRSDAGKVYREILGFLQVSDSFVPEMPVVNAHVHVRSQLAHRIFRRPPTYIRYAARALAPRPVRQVLAAKITRLNTEIAPRAPMPGDLRRYLQAEFATDVERLGVLLHRDLSGWLRG